MATWHRDVGTTLPDPAIVLRFVSRSSGKPCLAFPCNSAGDVELDRLSDRERNDYLFARALRGRDYELPVIERTRVANDPAVQLH